jgi:DNA-binding beta-propeller fold protein YncE
MTTKKGKERNIFIVLWKTSTQGTRDGQFTHPHGVAVDSKGNVFVSDRDHANIQKFTSDGKFMTKWGGEGGRR